MRCAILIVIASCAGCASYTQTKIDLTAQIRSGIESTRQATVLQHQVLDALAEAQIGRLDAAFDADVKSRDTISADWVIAHRKAYIAARDAMHEHRESLGASQARLESNLQSIDLALGQLQRIHAMEQQVRLPEVMK